MKKYILLIIVLLVTVIGANAQTLPPANQNPPGQNCFWYKFNIDITSLLVKMDDDNEFGKLDFSNRPDINFKYTAVRIKKRDGTTIIPSAEKQNYCYILYGQNNEAKFYVKNSDGEFKKEVNSCPSFEDCLIKFNTAPIPFAFYENNSQNLNPGDIKYIEIDFLVLENDDWIVGDGNCTVHGYNTDPNGCHEYTGNRLDRRKRWDCNDYEFQGTIRIDYTNNTPKDLNLSEADDPQYQYLADCDRYDYLNKSGYALALYNRLHFPGQPLEYIKVNAKVGFYCYTPQPTHKDECGQTEYGGIFNGLDRTICNYGKYEIYKGGTGDPNTESNDNDNDNDNVKISINEGDSTVATYHHLHWTKSTAIENITTDLFESINGKRPYQWIASNDRSYFPFLNKEFIFDEDLTDIIENPNKVEGDCDVYTQYEYIMRENGRLCGLDYLSGNPITIKVYPEFHVDRIIIDQPCKSNYPDELWGTVKVDTRGGNANGDNRISIYNGYKIVRSSINANIGNYTEIELNILTKVGEYINSILQPEENPEVDNTSTKTFNELKEIVENMSKNGLPQPMFTLELATVEYSDIENMCVHEIYDDNNNLLSSDCDSDARLYQSKSYIKLDECQNKRINLELKKTYQGQKKYLPFGIYYMEMEDMKAGACNRYKKMFCIYPQADPTITLSPDAIVCQNNGLGDIEITATANRPIENWQWSPNAGQQVDNLETELVSIVFPNINNTNDYDCGIKLRATDYSGCYKDVMVDIPNFNQPEYEADYREGLINIGASKLKGTWLHDFTDAYFENANAYEDMIDKNEYLTGQAGLYRTISAYDYLDSRSQTQDIKLREDGLLENNNITKTDDIPLFNWSNPKFEIEEPNWIKNGTITGYNSNNEESENRDILGNYSAILFGYKGTLPTAVGVNAKNREIAFESFEEYDPASTVPLTQVNNTTGNFDLVPKFEEITWKKYTRYSITHASGRYAITSIPVDINGVNGYTPSEIEGFNFKVVAFAPELKIEDYCVDLENPNLPQITKKYPIEENIFDTRAELLENNCNTPQGTLLKLEDGTPGFDTEREACIGDENNDFPFDICRFWYGDIYLVKEVNQSLITYPTISITEEEAHTGKRSLKIEPSSNLELEQIAIELQGGKEYLINGWIKSNQSALVPQSALLIYNNNQNIGFNIKFKKKDDTYLPNVEVIPNGVIVDGWQKFEHKFIAPLGTDKISLQFNNQQTMYLDDIRLCPNDGNIQTYVYDPSTYRQEAVLDQNNFATIYKYDEEGKLFQVKKETAEGIKTIQVKQSFIQPK